MVLLQRFQIVIGLYEILETYCVQTAIHLLGKCILLEYSRRVDLKFVTSHYPQGLTPSET